MAEWRVIATIIVAVFASSVFVFLLAWMFIKNFEKLERLPRYRRGLFIALATLYAIPMVIRIFEVALGRESIKALIGLPIGLVFVWFYLSAARKVRVAP